MSDKIMITLDQIESYNPYGSFWRELLEINGGRNADFNKPFPLSMLLDINNANNIDNIDGVVWCFRCLPYEYKAILVKFALFCAKRAANHLDDKLIKSCIDVIVGYLDGETGLNQLQETIAVANMIADDARIVYSYSRLGFAAKAIVSVATLIHAKDLDLIYSHATLAYNYATSVTIDEDAEAQEQADYLRQLLDGK